MDEFNDRDENNLEKLVKRFISAVDKNQTIYLDGDDLEDVIRSLLNYDQLPYAQKAIRQAVSQYPNDPYFRIYQAHYYHLKHEYDSEERELDYIESHFEPIPDTYYQRVLTALINGKEIDVIRMLEKAIAIDDVLPEVRLLLAYEYIVRQEIRNAVPHAIRAFQLDPSVFFELQALIDEELFPNHIAKNEDLIAFYRLLLEEMPMEESLWCGLGIAYMRAEQFDKASEAFEFQTSLEPEAPFAYVNLAESQFAAGKYHEAISNFQTANKLSDFFKFHGQIGRCYAKLHDYDNALKNLTKADSNDPTYPFVLHDIVSILKQQGEFEKARNYLRRNILRDPGDVESILSLIDLLDPEKDETEIRNLCFMALHREDPPILYVLFFLSKYAIQNDMHDTVIDLCSDYLGNPDFRPSVHYFMAALFVEKGMVTEGCRYLEYALQCDPSRIQLDFLEIDEDMAKIPEVAELIDIYASEAPADTDSLN
ncbi:MAG: hypothetical protein IK013_07100 [Bacteroidales bacterium]|nr:hypothetical protein [Bacteroidales bacterium]